MIYTWPNLFSIVLLVRTQDMDLMIKVNIVLIQQILIPKPPQDVSFRMTEQSMIKAHLFINGCSLKKRCNDGHTLLRHPRRAGLETFYAALLILTRTLHGCSLLENAGAYSPE